MLSDRDVKDLIAFAETLADASGAVILPHFREIIPVDNKKDDGTDYDPVTIADRDAEARIRDLIKAAHPDHGILGEEHGHEEGTSPLTWVIDPIDGTRAFIAGLPTWGTLIALNDGSQPVIGLMDQPFTGERFIGGPHGAWFKRRGDGRPMTASDCSALENAILCSTDPALFRLDAERAAFGELENRTRLRRFGNDCYAYCMLAMGQVDLVVETLLEPYDIQALIPIIRAAGGVVSDWTGGDAQNGGQVVAAATPALHEKALAILADAAL